MHVLIKVETAADEAGSTYHIKRNVNFGNLPIPVAGDEIYVDGVFLDVRKRCISPDETYEEGGEIEIFATVDHTSFKELEQKGWEPD